LWRGGERRRENSIGNTVYTIGKIACSIRRRIYTTDASSRLFLSPFFYHSSALPPMGGRAYDTNHAPFSFSLGYFYFFLLSTRSSSPMQSDKIHLCEERGGKGARSFTVWRVYSAAAAAAPRRLPCFIHKIKKNAHSENRTNIYPRHTLESEEQQQQQQQQRQTPLKDTARTRYSSPSVRRVLFFHRTSQSTVTLCTRTCIAGKFSGLISARAQKHNIMSPVHIYYTPPCVFGRSASAHACIYIYYYCNA